LSFLHTITIIELAPKSEGKLAMSLEAQQDFASLVQSPLSTGTWKPEKQFLIVLSCLLEKSVPSVARWFIFKPKNPNLVNFGGP
jgi:hypothetical protein